jgi:hypothetical protein
MRRHGTPASDEHACSRVVGFFADGHAGGMPPVEQHAIHGPEFAQFVHGSTFRHVLEYSENQSPFLAIDAEGRTRIGGLR